MTSETQKSNTNAVLDGHKDQSVGVKSLTNTVLHSQETETVKSHTNTVLGQVVGSCSDYTECSYTILEPPSSDQYICTQNIILEPNPHVRQAQNSVYSVLVEPGVFNQHQQSMYSIFDETRSYTVKSNSLASLSRVQSTKNVKTLSNPTLGTDDSASFKIKADCVLTDDVFQFLKHYQTNKYSIILLEEEPLTLKEYKTNSHTIVSPGPSLKTTTIVNHNIGEISPALKNIKQEKYGILEESKDSNKHYNTQQYSMLIFEGDLRQYQNLKHTIVHLGDPITQHQSQDYMFLVEHGVHKQQVSSSYSFLFKDTLKQSSTTKHSFLKPKSTTSTGSSLYGVINTENLMTSYQTQNYNFLERTGLFENSFSTLSLTIMEKRGDFCLQRQSSVYSTLHLDNKFKGSSTQSYDILSEEIIENFTVRKSASYRIFDAEYHRNFQTSRYDVLSFIPTEKLVQYEVQSFWIIAPEQVPLNENSKGFVS